MTGASPVGRVGRVTVAVRGRQRPGEVEVVVQGLPETYIAYSTEPLAYAAAALVIHDRGERSLDVVPWSFPPGLGVDDAAGQPGR
ncbi:MAG: hypothetical protein JWL64_582 [Frankiales bacterium]|nr:hypothetical protein [Frankiales bacterium]